MDLQQPLGQADLVVGGGVDAPAPVVQADHEGQPQIAHAQLGIKCGQGLRIGAAENLHFRQGGFQQLHGGMLRKLGHQQGPARQRPEIFGNFQHFPQQMLRWFAAGVGIDQKGILSPGQKLLHRAVWQRKGHIFQPLAGLILRQRDGKVAIPMKHHVPHGHAGGAVDLPGGSGDAVTPRLQGEGVAAFQGKLRAL